MKVSDAMVNVVGGTLFGHTWERVESDPWHRERIAGALADVFALAVADADAPDGEFEEALDALLESWEPAYLAEQAEPAVGLSWRGRAALNEFENARARVLALHRSAEQKGLREVDALKEHLAELVRESLADLKRPEYVDDDEAWSETECDLIHYINEQIDAMLKEGTNG